MGLQRITADKFRCLSHVDVEPDPSVNLIIGRNGAGKTSFLEAIFFLSRARSFRAPQASGLVQTGADVFTVYGEILVRDTLRRLGIQAGRGAMEIHVDEQPESVATLAASFPVQIIEPAIHELVQGGPDRRRQFIDWGVFHVKHDFLTEWRRYRRALKQRNASLRGGEADDAVEAWNAELVAAAATIDAGRRDFLAVFEPELNRIFDALAGLSVAYEYNPGWKTELSLEDALARSLPRDRVHQSTQTGPHRAELRFTVDGERARHRLSRGQQKLLGAALVLAQAVFVTESTARPVVLLVDEPAAELDQDHLERLLVTLTDTQLQLFISALDVDALPLSGKARVFHVEHGEVSDLL